MVRYKKSSSVIYAHFKEKRKGQSMDILVRDGEPKFRPPGSKSTTSFSRNTDLTKSQSTNIYVTSKTPGQLKVNIQRPFWTVE